MLRTSQFVTFAGFDDVDNHYGIFVFTDLEGTVLEVTGGFSGRASYKPIELQRAIKSLKNPGNHYPKNHKEKKKSEQHKLQLSKQTIAGCDGKHHEQHNGDKEGNNRGGFQAQSGLQVYGRKFR